MTSTLKLAWLVTARHWKVYKKYFWSNILPTVIEPCFFILSLGVGMAAFVGQIDGLSYATFMGPGLAMSAAMFTAFFESSYGFYVRLTMDGVYKAMFTTPISPREVIFGELIWVSLKGAVMSLVVSLIFIAFGFLYITPNLLGIMAVGFFVGASCGCMGLISAATIKNMSQFQTVYALVISPLFFFSGNLFPIDRLPAPLVAIAHFSPLYHGVLLAQQLLWQRVNLAVFAQHFAELIVLTVIFCGIAYYKVYRKLYQ
jgi:lipooligosaccharide transport system permease protein